MYTFFSIWKPIREIMEDFGGSGRDTHVEDWEIV
jgi:hypothetical protein